MRSSESCFIKFKREVFFLLSKIINLDERLTIIIETEKKEQDKTIVFKVDINDMIMKL
jgi:hypothetical protein